MIREAVVTDAAQLAALIMEVEASAPFMLWEAGERSLDTATQEKMIASMEASGNSTIILAENAEKALIGYCFAIGGKAKRNQHTAYLVIGLLSDYRGKGVGTKLLSYLDGWAKKSGLHRLELTVVTENAGAVALYEKMGFKIEGRKKHSLWLENRFVDEYYMGKCFSSTST